MRGNPLLRDRLPAFLVKTFILHYHDTIHMPDARDPFGEANELVELGRLDEALAIFQALLKTDSNNATLWNNVGIIRFRQGKYRTSGVRRSPIYINYFYMTSIWGVPAAFPGTGRTELHPRKPP